MDVRPNVSPIDVIKKVLLVVLVLKIFTLV